MVENKIKGKSPAKQKQHVYSALLIRRKRSDWLRRSFFPYLIIKTSAFPPRPAPLPK